MTGAALDLGAPWFLLGLLPVAATPALLWWRRRRGKDPAMRFSSHRLVAGNDPNLAAMPWREAGVLPRFGSVEPGEPVTLSYALLGVAEIGAIVTLTGKANPAANNLLSEHHIVVVDSTRLVRDMEAAWKIIATESARTGRPRGINFIAGPSSTADIEGKLVYGAHGPRNWHVIMMGDLPATTVAEAHALAGR